MASSDRGACALTLAHAHQHLSHSKNWKFTELLSAVFWALMKALMSVNNLGLPFTSARVMAFSLKIPGQSSINQTTSKRKSESLFMIYLYHSMFEERGENNIN